MTDENDKLPEPVFAPVTEAELDEISSSMTACEDIWMKAVAASTPATTCPECGGRGESSMGSLGNYCATCDGAGVVEDELDDRPRLELPAGMKDARAKYKALRAGFDANVPTSRGQAVKLLGEIKVLAKEAGPAYRKIVTDPKDRQIVALERRIAELEKHQLPAGDDEG